MEPTSHVEKHEVPPLDDPLITYPQLKQFNINFSRRAIWELWRKGMFPAPLELSTHRIAWRRSDIVTWIDNLPRKKRQELSKKDPSRGGRPQKRR
jgi:predicted DNA-binding transcriptional regulator AlpA